MPQQLAASIDPLTILMPVDASNGLLGLTISFVARSAVLAQSDS